MYYIKKKRNNMINPYKEMGDIELKIIQEGLLKTVSRGYGNSKSKLPAAEVKVLQDIITNIMTELRSR